MMLIPHVDFQVADQCYPLYDPKVNVSRASRYIDESYWKHNLSSMLKVAFCQLRQSD